MADQRTGRPYRTARVNLMANPTCVLCGQPIDLTLKTWTNPRTGKEALHPDSFSAHHKVPYSQGGTNKDLAPSHLHCNQEQGDKLTPVVDRHSSAWY